MKSSFSMSKVDTQEEREERIERIQAIVEEDYQRIQDTRDPYVVLNLDSTVDFEEVRDRYERYERFYRAENFQRLGNMDLTRKALDVRRAIGRAMVQIQSKQGQGGAAPIPSLNQDPELPDVDEDAAAMGDIYFRDGLSYLRLGDYGAAHDYFQRASDYDPSRGIILANLAYTQFKLDPTSPDVIDETGRNLRRAASMDPDNAEVFVLAARFGINTQDEEMAGSAIERIEELAPGHPRLKRLKKRANF